MSPSPEPTEDQASSAFFTLVVVFGPVLFFAFYLVAAWVPGSRGYLGPFLLSLFCAAAYLGVTLLGTAWFRNHREP